MSLVDFLHLVICVYHEGRGEPPAGQRAIVHVVLNRSKKRKINIEQVIKQPKQFSFIDNSGNYPTITDQKAFIACAKNVEDAIKERVSGGFDLEGADHYHADYVNPSWATDMLMIKKIGRHIFYRAK